MSSTLKRPAAKLLKRFDVGQIGDDTVGAYLEKGWSATAVMTVTEYDHVRRFIDVNVQGPYAAGLEGDLVVRLSSPLLYFCARGLLRCPLADPDDLTVVVVDRRCLPAVSARFIASPGSDGDDLSCDGAQDIRRAETLLSARLSRRSSAPRP